MISSWTETSSLQIQLLDNSTSLNESGIIAKKDKRLWSLLKVTFSYPSPSWLLELLKTVVGTENGRESLKLVSETILVQTTVGDGMSELVVPQDHDFHFHWYGSSGPVPRLSVHVSHSFTQMASTTRLLEGEWAGWPAFTNDLKETKTQFNDFTDFVQRVFFLATLLPNNGNDDCHLS